MELIDKTASVQHLAGIVPIGGQPLDFNMPWHDSLLPIAPDYLAVERAVFQCALAGCETIWIVGHLGTQPLVRKRIGDVIIDPATALNHKSAYMATKQISIYYVPIHPKDRLKRDCLGWSVLYGADSAYRIADFISKWIAPEKFFCSFPYGIVPDEALKENRLLLSSKQNVIFSYNNKTIKDNLHLPFTFNADDFFRCRDIVKHKQATEWGEKSARYYDLAAVFKGVDTTSSYMLNLSWFHDISSWNNYKAYMASEQAGIYVKPSTLFKGIRRKYYETKHNIQEDKG